MIWQGRIEPHSGFVLFDRHDECQVMRSHPCPSNNKYDKNQSTRHRVVGNRPLT